MRLLLVDDHDCVREGIKLVVELHKDALPTGEQLQVLQARSVADALEVIAREGTIDLVLLDLHMPGMVGLDALVAMREQAESTPVVVLSGSEDAQIVWQAIDAGAMGFIQKQINSKAMMSALRVVLEGGIYLPPVCMTEEGRRRPALPAELDSGQRLRQLGISSRQAQVLALLLQAKPTKRIATALNISEATVKTHLSVVYSALDVHSRAEALVAVARLGLRLNEIEA